MRLSEPMEKSGFFLISDVTHRLNNVLYSKDVAPRMGFVIPVTLQIMVVD